MTGEAGENQVRDFQALVPEGYKDKGWVKDVPDVPTFFKMFDDQKAALSRRPAGIPDDSATAEAWAAFNKAFGVPENATDYGVDPGKDRGYLLELAKNAGLSKRQAKAMIEGLSPKLDEAIKQAETRFSPDEFLKMQTEAFGDKAEEVAKNAHTLLHSKTPEALKPYLERLPNEAVLVMAGALDAIYRESYAEGSIPGSGGGAGAVDSKEEINKLWASKEFQDPTHPNHASVKARIENYYKAQAKAS